MQSEKEYSELTQLTRLAQEQFVIGVKTGQQEEYNRIIQLLLDKDVLRESLFSTPEERVYVAMDTNGEEAIELGDLKDSLRAT